MEDPVQAYVWSFIDFLLFIGLFLFYLSVCLFVCLFICFCHRAWFVWISWKTAGVQHWPFLKFCFRLAPCLPTQIPVGSMTHYTWFPNSWACVYHKIQRQIKRKRAIYSDIFCNVGNHCLSYNDPRNVWSNFHVLLAQSVSVLICEYTPLTRTCGQELKRKERQWQWQWH